MQDADPRPNPIRRDITIAFDGACLVNPGPGGYGAILVNQRTGREKIVSGGAPATTNNRMELTAAIEGLAALNPGAYVTMIGDSEYVIKGFTQWLPGWKAKGWRKADRKPVLNVELWQALESAVARQADVRWEWVRGHNGHALNERVDQLAAAEAARQLKRPGNSI